MVREGDFEQIPVPGVEEPPKPSSFYACLPGAFAFPFRKGGWAMIVAGTIVFTGLEFVLRVVVPMILPIPRIGVGLAVIMSLLAGGYFCALMIKILGEVAGGEDAPPDWPSLTNFMDDVIRPAMLFLGTCVIAWAPLLGYLIGARANPEKVTWVESVLAVTGAVYLPMGLIAVALYGSCSGLNPVTVVKGIARTIPAYVVAVVALAIVYAANIAVQLGVSAKAPFGISPLTWAATTYFVMVEMYILGRLYYTHSRRLGWFE